MLNLHIFGDIFGLYFCAPGVVPMSFPLSGTPSLTRPGVRLAPKQLVSWCRDSLDWTHRWAPAQGERWSRPLTRGAILWNYPPGRRGGTGLPPHNMRRPTLCGAAPCCCIKWCLAYCGAMGLCHAFFQYSIALLVRGWF